MRNRRSRIAALLLALSGLLALPWAAPLSAQPPAIKKAYLGLPMSDFELPTLDGQLVRLSSLRGKNVLLVFPRVFYATDEDCSLCAYQYADLAARSQAGRWQETHDLQVLYVFPFAADVIRAWLARTPAMLETVEGWKNPPEADLQQEQTRNWMEVLRQACPGTYAFSAGEVPLPFPILVDEQRALSRGLDLFREEWGGGKGEQNIPSVFLLDKEGVVRFKLIGQSPLDRPSAAYLEKIMEAVL